MPRASSATRAAPTTPASSPTTRRRRRSPKPPSRSCSLGRFKEKIATAILPAGAFWVAEDYHQDYYKKNPHRYQYYKTACGRASRLEQIWGPPKPPQTLTQ